MITVETARSGHKVVKKDGRYLGSSYDPIKEARSWAAAAFERCRDAQAVFIIGLGCGYHVFELIRLASRLDIRVIESDRELAAQIELLQPDMPLERLIAGVPAASLLDEPRIRRHLHHAYVVLEHPSAALTDPEYASEAREWLLGRTPRSFRRHLELRPESSALFDINALDHQRQTPISIRTLRTLRREVVSPDAAFANAVWNALGELVKP